MEVKEILEKALAFYDDHDWIQSQSFSHRAPEDPGDPDVLAGACLEGACRAVAQPVYVLGIRAPLAAQDAWQALADAAYELFPERFPLEMPGPVYKFNDHELTTREDVLLVLKSAIKKAEDGSHDRAEPAG